MSVIKQVEKIQHIETGLERWFGGEALATHECGQVFGCPACMQIQHACGITDGVTLEGWKAEPGKLQSKLTTLQAELSVTEFKSEALSQYTRWRAKEVWSLHSHTHKCVSTHI